MFFQDSYILEVDHLHNYNYLDTIVIQILYQKPSIRIENVPLTSPFDSGSPPLANMDISPHSRDHLHSLEGISKKFARTSLYRMISLKVSNSHQQ